MRGCVSMFILAAVSYSILPNGILTEVSNDCFLLSWAKLENWRNGNYCLKVTPNKNHSPVIEYILDNQGNSTLKTLCIEKRDAKYEIIKAAKGRQCENSADVHPLQDLFTSESRVSEVEKYIRQKWTYMLVGAGAIFILLIFLAVTFVCLRNICKSSMKNRGSHFSLDSDTGEGDFSSQRHTGDNRTTDSRHSDTSSASSGNETGGSKKESEGSEPTPPLEGSPFVLPGVQGRCPVAPPGRPRRELPLLPDGMGSNLFTTLPRHHVASRSLDPNEETSSAVLDRLSTRPPAPLPRLFGADTCRPASTLPRPPASPLTRPPASILPRPPTSILPRLPGSPLPRSPASTLPRPLPSTLPRRPSSPLPRPSGSPLPRPPTSALPLPPRGNLPRHPAVALLRPSGATLAPGSWDSLSRQPPVPSPPESGITVSRLRPLSPSRRAGGPSDRAAAPSVPGTSQVPPPLPPFTQRPPLTTATSSTLPRPRDHALPAHPPRSFSLSTAGTLPHSRISKRPLPPIPRY